MISIENAKKLIQAREFTKAEKVCHEIIAHQPEKQKAYFFLAIISELLNKDIDALGHLNNALSIGAPRAEILRKYGQILSRLSEPNLAIEKYNEALAINRTKPILLDLGQALIASNNPEKAKATFKEALSLDKDCITSLHQLGRMAYEEGKTDKFIKYVEREQKLKPKDPRLIVSLLMVYLETSNFQKALSLCDSGLSIYPTLCPLYAMKYIVLAEMGKPEAAREIMHFDTLLKRIPAKCPNKYTDIIALNNELVDHTINRAMKATDQEKYTTRFGWQTEHGKLFENNIELGAIVDNMIQNSVQEYISNLPDDPNHPVNVSRPKQYSIESWCVVLNTNGHQSPHIHPSAWLSGVYYIKLPEDFNHQITPDAGHIVFGKGKEDLHHVDSPETITLKPVEGDFVIFPSYFWHHTIPLESKFERICLAFNVVPALGHNP